MLGEPGQKRRDVTLGGDPQAGGGRIMLKLADHRLGDAIVVGAQAEGAAPAACPEFDVVIAASTFTKGLGHRGCSRGPSARVSGPASSSDCR